MITFAMFTDHQGRRLPVILKKKYLHYLFSFLYVILDS
jgi:hypothetical protein